LIVNYGYRDGAGLWIITVDTDKCDACGRCAEACPYSVLEIVANEYDPLSEGLIPSVKEEHRKKIRYSCAPCKPISKNEGEITEPCIKVCLGEAISHSW
jgi:ferredoxin